MTGPPHDLPAERQDRPPLAGNSQASSGKAAHADSREGGLPSRLPRAGASPSEGGGHFLSLLFEEASAAGGAEGQDEDRSFASDLNLDQIVTAIAGDREERDLITTVLYGHLRDGHALRLTVPGRHRPDPTRSMMQQEAVVDVEVVIEIRRDRGTNTRWITPPAGSGWTGCCSPRPATRWITGSSRTR